MYSQSKTLNDESKVEKGGEERLQYPIIEREYNENYKTLMKEIKEHMQKERFSVFLGGKNQYCEKDYATKCNLQIQKDPYQITNGIFFPRNRTKNFTIHMKGNTKDPE